MPGKHVKGTGRFEVRCEPWLADAIADGARREDRSASAFIRQAVIARLQALGIQVSGPEAKPRGRPKSRVKAAG